MWTSLAVELIQMCGDRCIECVGSVPRIEVPQLSALQTSRILRGLGGKVMR
jgi:hypothetical protein